MVPPRIWHVWPGLARPATLAEEIELVAALAAIANARRPRGTGPAPRRKRVTEAPDRMHHTAILNALRGGVNAETLLENLPGTSAADLLSAYTQLETARALAAAAWHALVADPTRAGIARCTPAASILLPAVTLRLTNLAATARKEATVASSVTLAAGAVNDTAALVYRIEAAMVNAGDTPAAVALGEKLHHPAEPGLWSSAFYLPDRVASLSPVRVATILGELTT